MYAMRSYRPFNLYSKIKNSFGLFAIFIFLLELQIFFNRGLKQYVTALYGRRDHLCYPISICVWHLQHPRSALNRVAPCHTPKSGNVGYTFRTILVYTVLNYLITS